MTAPAEFRSRLLSMLAALAAGILACGGPGDSGDRPDAAPANPTDAGPEKTLEAGLNDNPVCPGGFTIELSALKSDARQEITLVGQCSEATEDVYVIFKPIPSPGGTAPCFQATIRETAELRANCREGSAVDPAPEGELTLSADGKTISGDCQCTAENVGRVVFQMPLEDEV